MAAKPRNQFGRRTFRNYLSVIHDGKPVTEPLRLVHVMRGQENWPPRLLERANDAPELAAALRIKSGSRLVEEKYLWGTDERGRYRQALALAARKFADPGIGLFLKLQSFKNLTAGSR